MIHELATESTKSEIPFMTDDIVTHLHQDSTPIMTTIIATVSMPATNSQYILMVKLASGSSNPQNMMVVFKSSVSDTIVRILVSGIPN